MRSLFYFARLDTIEEGAPCTDVGIQIFREFNITHGLPVPVPVQFEYDARIPHARKRVVARARRVRDAIRARYPDLVARGLLSSAIAVSDRTGGEYCTFVSDDIIDDR